MRVSWTAPDDGGSPITRYEVRVTRLDGTEELRSTTGTTLDVTGLTNGEDYFFAVRAENARGLGPWSPEVGAVPRGGTGCAAHDGS